MANDSDDSKTQGFPPGLSKSDYLTSEQVALLMKRSARWVRNHAIEFNGVRVDTRGTSVYYFPKAEMEARRVDRVAKEADPKVRLRDEVFAAHSMNPAAYPVERIASLLEMDLVEVKRAHRIWGSTRALAGLTVPTLQSSLTIRAERQKALEAMHKVYDREAATFDKEAPTLKKPSLNFHTSDRAARRRAENALNIERIERRLATFTKG